jgi:DNA mismatch endonuclease (patch repair protein)
MSSRSRKPVLEKSADARPTRLRSLLMSRVKSKNTRPELIVRSAFHRLGARFRLHAKKLPGSPDLVFPSRRMVVFVHGCFWHRHTGCSKTSTPKTRKVFWESKFRANIARDCRVVRDLKKQGWRPVVIWECETLHMQKLEKRIKRLLKT